MGKKRNRTNSVSGQDIKNNLSKTLTNSKPLAISQMFQGLAAEPSLDPSEEEKEL